MELGISFSNKMRLCLAPLGNASISHFIAWKASSCDILAFVCFILDIRED